jgi:hypothetical protein
MDIIYCTLSYVSKGALPLKTLVFYIYRSKDIMQYNQQLYTIYSSYSEDQLNPGRGSGGGGGEGGSPTSMGWQGNGGQPRGSGVAPVAPTQLVGIRTTLLHQKERERAWRDGSPKGGKLAVVRHGAMVLQWMRSGTAGTMSSSEGRGSSENCT